MPNENGELRSIVVTHHLPERPDEADVHADHVHLVLLIERLHVPNMSRDDGFTLTELLVATTVMLLVIGAALTTFKNALTINDSASQLADANQNLRAGTNQLIRDLMMAGRIIGPGGIALPTAGGGGITPFFRPGPPPGATLTFALTSIRATTSTAEPAGHHDRAISSARPSTARRPTWSRS